MREQPNKIIWKDYDLKDNKLFSWEIGNLKLWCQSTTNEIQIISKHITNDETKNQKEPPEDIIWSRWALKDNNSKIQFKPIFPDRSVVVKPESSFWLMMDTQAQIYIRIPIWLQINLIKQKPIHLIDIPTVILSNTWFGTFFEGELCYWISSGVRQQIEPDPIRSYSVACPIKLINKSKEDLLVEKICLKVDNLSLFLNNEQLWSDETQMLYKGSNNISQIKATGKPPKESPSAVLLTPPKKPLKDSIMTKTFASLKDLPSLGVQTS